MSGGTSNYTAAGISLGTTEDAMIAKGDALKHDAMVAENNAATVRQQGAASDQALERDINATLGTMRAAYGGSGVDASQGSPLEVLGDSIRRGVLDRATNKYNYAIQEKNYTDQAAALRLEAKNVKRAAWPTALSASLTSLNGGAGGTGGMGTTQGGNVQPLGGYSPWSGGNSLTGGTYTGPGSTSTSWAGDSGGWGVEDSSMSWPGSGGGWGS